MNRVTMQAPPKFVQSPRIQKLAQRSRELAISTRHTCPDLAIGLSRIYQKEFVDRMNYEGL